MKHRKLPADCSHLCRRGCPTALPAAKAALHGQAKCRPGSGCLPAMPSSRLGHLPSTKCQSRGLWLVGTGRSHAISNAARARAGVQLAVNINQVGRERRVVQSDSAANRPLRPLHNCCSSVVTLPQAPQAAASAGTQPALHARPGTPSENVLQLSAGSVNGAAVADGQGGETAWYGSQTEGRDAWVQGQACKKAEQGKLQTGNEAAAQAVQCTRMARAHTVKGGRAIAGNVV